MQIDIEQLKKEARKYKSLCEKRYNDDAVEGLSPPSSETKDDTEDTEAEVPIFLLSIKFCLSLIL